MISVTGSRELQAAVLAMKAADRDLRREINRATRETMNPVWRQAIADNLAGRDHVTSRVIDNGVRIAAGNPPAAKAAQSKRGLGRQKRLIPAEHWAWFEFGTGNPQKYSRYLRRNRKRGGTHQVNRRASRGLPRFTKRGRVAHPAFAHVAPRMVSLWAQLIVKKYMDAAERNT